MKKLYGFLLMVALLLPFAEQAQDVIYSCNFQDESDSAGWVLLNGTQTNQWYIGTDSLRTGSRALLVSNIDSATNEYTNSVTSVVYAYREVELTTGGYYISYNWHGYGEGSYDYLRVFLAPSSAVISAGFLPDGTTSTYSFGNTVPAGWIPLDGSSRLNLESTWQYYECEFSITTADTYKLVFMWCNDGSAGTNPPAAVDNIFLAQPTCARPVMPYVENLTTTTFDLYWSDMTDGYATQWEVELDSATQTRGQGTLYVTSDTTISFSGLTPNTLYTLWISAVCSGSDTSMALHYQVQTPCNLLTSLPYFQDFESVPSGSNMSSNFVNCWFRQNDGTTYFGYPYVSSSSTYSHNGGTRGLYWYNTTSVGAYGSYQCIALPGFDTDFVQMRNVQLSFWAKSTNTSYRPVFEVGVMTNPSDVTSFTRIATVNITSTEWEQYVVDFGGYSGTANFIAVMGRATTASWYAALDEFTIARRPACHPVYHVEANNTGTTGTLLTWDLRGADSTIGSYQVRIDSAAAPTAWIDSSDVLTNPVRFTTTEPRCLVTGLRPGVTYRALVRAVCVNDSISTWDSVSFTTHNLPCAIVDPTRTDTVVCGTGSSQVSGVPVYSSWGNSLCQSIYTASELIDLGVSAGEISGLDYTFTTNSSYAKLFSIYITTTDRTLYSSPSDMVTVRATDLVYGPAAHPLNTTGTVHYDFTTPFSWDGSSNIVITTMMNQPNGASHSSSSFYGYSTNLGVARTIYRYQDGTQYTPANSTGGSGSGTSTYRPTITFYSFGCLTPATCAAPTLMMERIESDTAEVSWIPGNEETSWNVWLKEADSTTWNVVATSLSTNHYTLTDIHPMRQYQLRVAPDCGGDSVFAQTEFSTPCVPLTTLPFTENFENFVAPSSGSAITDCWTRGNNFSGTSYPYLYSSYHNSGSYSLYFYNSSASTYSYLALPGIAVSVDSLQVSFAAYKTSSNYSIKVGVMTDPTDFNTFTEVETVSPAATSTWEMFEIPLSSYAGEGRYIALAAMGTSYNYMYIDDIEVSLIPTCPRPREVAFSGITTTNATVTWSDSSATNFEITYGPSGFALGTGTTVTSTLESVTLYGLRHSTRYDVYVRAICAVGDTSNWSFVSSFITECGTIDTLPYTQNFSGWGAGTGARPACWACGGYSSYPYVMNVTDINNEVIGQTFYMYCYGSNQVYASLPELDSVTYPIHVVQTIFKAWSNATESATYSHSVIVGVCSMQGDMGSFTPIDTVELSSTPTEYEVSFEDAIGAGKYITFVSTALDGASYNYVYLDSVAVEMIPDCQRPNHISASNVTATAADIAWNDRSISLQWQVEYTLQGFGVGSGTRVTTTSNPISLIGLLPSTSYDVYVRSVCGTGDTSQWSTPYNLITSQNPATVPYFYDFETSVEWDNWQFASNTPITWYRDTAAGNGTNGYGATGTHTMYISADSGLTYSTNINTIVNAVAYRDIDFGDIDSTYLLSFRAAAGGRRVETSVYDGLAVFMVDPSEPMQPSSNSPLVSPWGNVNNLTLLTTVYCQPGWNTYSVILDTLTGIHRLVFYWFNQGSGTPGIFLGGPAAVDDISIQYMSCPRPAGLRTTNITMASATVRWHGLETGDYRVTLRTAGSTVFSDVVHTNSIHLTGLTPNTTYTAQVRRLCSESDSSLLPTCNFTTLMCNDATIDTIGNASTTTTSYSIPINNYYSYTYTQEIVLSSELGGSGDISGISFYYSGTSPITNKSGCTIYMAHTTLSSFSSTADIIDPETMSIVYTGHMNCTPGWNQLRFSTPFTYDGSHNIVIAIDDNSGSYSSMSNTFLTSPATAQMTLTLYGDGQNPDCSSLSALNSFTGTKELYGYRNLMVLELCAPNMCPPPPLRDPIVRSENVTLRWRNTGTLYNVGYRLASSSSWISANITTTDTFYTINHLYPMTDYVYRVRQHCDTNGVSIWTEGRFNSSDVPCLSPMGLEVMEVTNNKVKIRWTPEENNTGYKLHVFNSYFDNVKTVYLAQGTINGLDANTRYYASVQAVCQGFDEPSEWSDTISFVTDVCPDVTNLTASNVQGNSVDLDWYDSGRGIAWEVEWGLEGFDIGSGVRVNADHHPFVLTGLTGETTYDIYVRAVCGSSFFSENWSNRVTITTQYSSINSAIDDARVILFPNPTSSDVELTMPTSHSEVRVEVIDIEGRVSLSALLPAGTAKTTLSTSQLSQGAYYVRVVGGDINAVKKLIVK